MSTSENSDSVPSLVWRTAGANPGRTAFSPASLRAVPDAHRTLQAAATVRASVVFNGSGTAFVADLSGGVQAFTPEGILRWRRELPAGVEATPTVAPDDRRLFVGTLNGSVVALDSDSGQVLWQHDLRTQSDPRILSHLLYEPRTESLVLSSWGGRWVRLDPGTGAEQASWDAGIYPQSAAASDAAGHLLVLRGVNERGVELVQLDAANGESVLYREPESSRGARRMMVIAAPVIDPTSRTVSFAINRDRDCTVHRWSLEKGSELWRCALPCSVQAAPALGSDGTLLVADLAGSVHAVSSDGQIRWTYDSGCEYLLAGAIIDGSQTGWIGDPLGGLHRLSADGSGELVVSTGRSIEAQPSVSPRGELILPATDGRVHVWGGRAVQG